MRTILFALLLLTAVSCSGKIETAYTQSELDQAYLSMPQLLFEDLCLEHSDWSEDQMATYYLNNKIGFDQKYQE
ncbi:MAG: hypothetical protein SNH27_07415 [Rikenellaceae bacterium]